MCNKITFVGAHEKPGYRFRDTRLPLEETARLLLFLWIRSSSLLCRLCVTEGGRFRSKFSALWARGLNLSYWPAEREATIGPRRVRGEGRGRGIKWSWHTVAASQWLNLTLARLRLLATVSPRRSSPRNRAYARQTRCTHFRHRDVEFVGVSLLGVTGNFEQLLQTSFVIESRAGNSVGSHDVTRHTLSDDQRDSRTVKIYRSLRRKRWWFIFKLIVISRFLIRVAFCPSALNITRMM